jgi:hypothetical protein
MDGRTQEPAIAWMKQRTGAEFVDSITEAGPDGILNNPDHPGLTSIIERILISRDKHGSRTLALVAHYDCAGNPGEREMHLQHLQQARKTLSGKDLGMEFLSLWIDENWEVQVISEGTI